MVPRDAVGSREVSYTDFEIIRGFFPLFCCWCLLLSFRGDDHGVSGRVVVADPFDHLWRVVAGEFEEHGSQSVGDGLVRAVQDDAVAAEVQEGVVGRSERDVLGPATPKTGDSFVELRPQFFMAAGRHEDGRCVGSNGSEESVVRRRVAGVERHCDSPLAFVDWEITNFSRDEFQETVALQGCCDDAVGVVDETLASFDADDFDALFALLVEEMVRGEGQVAFPRAEVDEPRRFASDSFVENVDELTDLRELTVSSYEPRGVDEPERPQEPQCLVVLRKRSIFLAVVRERH